MLLEILLQLLILWGNFKIAPMKDITKSCNEQRIQASFYQMGMRKKIQNFMVAYDIFLCNKFEQFVPLGLLQPFPIPTQVWE